MATKFVYSGAAGANDGTSWTDAWTSLASSNGVAAGDIVKVHKTHSQTGLASSINWTNSTGNNPVRIICVDKDASDALATGALVAWNAASTGPFGNLFVYGMHFRQATGNLFIQSSQAVANGMMWLEECTLSITGTGDIDPGPGTRGMHVWRNVHIDLSGGAAATNAMYIGNLGRLIWRGGSYTCRATQNRLFYTINSGSALVDIEGVEFIGTVTDIQNSASGSNSQLRLTLSRCKAPTYTNVFGGNGMGAFFAELDVDLFESGTITVPSVGPKRYRNTGNIASSLTRYRTGGADDGEQANPYSWEMAANSTATDFVAPLVSPPITRWVDSGAQTLTIYVASGVTLQDDECWLEVLSPSEAGSATAQAKFRSTRAAPLATPANLTTDGSSTWNGSGVGTKQKIDVSISPTIAGPVSVRVHLAKPSTTVYVDPRLEVA